MTCHECRPPSWGAADIDFMEQCEQREYERNERETWS